MRGTRHFRNPVQMNRLKDGNSKNHLHNGGSAPNSNRNALSEAASISPGKTHYGQHFEEQKISKKKSDMTLEDMYNSNYEFEDDEDNDSDWEPAFLGRNVLECPNWFCLNCTMNNSGTNIHCYLCGEHRESGIVKHGFLAPPFSQAEGLTGNESDAVDRLKDLRSKSLAADNTTAIGFDERMLLHEEAEMKSRPHVERPDRLRAIAASLAASGIFPGKCYPISAREITHEELLMVHSPDNIEAVELTSHMFSSYFTPDTYANQHSACAARLAAGLCSDLATAICSGAAKNGFALVRPPGHHAGVKQAMGFCLHNNAAIAAFAAQRAGAKKVLIIDWDVHHGNGTQEIFEKNKSVLYVSLHRYEGGMFYPGTGAADEVGTMGAEGHCVNVPWSRGGVGDNDYIFAFQQVVIPIASEFDPDFTIISAGFDAARGDPLGCCDVTPTGYEQMTQMCSALSGGKLLVILEGGYNLRSISSSATAVIKVLLGDTPEHDVEQVVPTKAGLRTVLEVLKIQIKYWPLMEPKFLKLQSEWGWYALQDKSKMVNVHKLISKRLKGGDNVGSSRQGGVKFGSSNRKHPRSAPEKGSRPRPRPNPCPKGVDISSSSHRGSGSELAPLPKRAKPASPNPVCHGKGKSLCPLSIIDPSKDLWNHPEIGVALSRHNIRDADMAYLRSRSAEELMNLALSDVAKVTVTMQALGNKALAYEEMHVKAKKYKERYRSLSRELAQLKLERDISLKQLEDELDDVKKELKAEVASGHRFFKSFRGKRYMKFHDERVISKYEGSERSRPFRERVISKYTQSKEFNSVKENIISDFKRSDSFNEAVEDASVSVFDECLAYLQERLINSGRFPGEKFEFLDPSWVELTEGSPLEHSTAANAMDLGGEDA